MRPLRTLCAVAMFASVMTGRTQAGSITWGFDWSGSTVLISPDPFSATSLGSGSVTLTAQKGTGTDSQTITAVTLATISAASTDPGPPDRYTNRPYTLNLDLTDTASNKSKVLSFSGLLNGTVTSSTVSLSTVFTGSTTLSTTLGGNSYAVSIGPFSSPSATPGDPADGSGFIRASVRVSPVDGGPGVGGNNSPEPSTFLLASVGVAGMAYWRRRRKAGTTSESA